jgi:general secretion pathway protein L
MSQLLVTLPPPEGNQVELVYALVSSGGSLTKQGRAVPALLPKADQATLIVPAQAISWHAVQLPKMPRGSSAQKMQAVLAGVLEEQLLDDPAQMHLAACPTISADGKTWVAAVQKSWLQDAVAELQAARVPLTRIVPQVFPTEVARLHVHSAADGSAEAAWLTYSDSQGVMNLPLSQAMLLPAMPEGAALSAEPSVAAAAEHVLGQRMHVVQAVQLAMQSVKAAQELGVDLAQGDLAVSSGGRAWQSLMGFFSDLLIAPVWRPVRWGFGLVLLANVIGLNAWSYKQTAALQDKRAQMNQLLSQTFPNVKVVVDAPLQMQRELAALRQAQGQLSGRDFESIYGRFSSVAGANTTPAAIDYIANEVQIRGSAQSSVQLDSLMPRLQYAGLQVRSEAQAVIVSHRDGPAPVASSTTGAKP